MNDDLQLPIPISEIDKDYRERYTELLEIIESFCNSHLNDEYLDSCYRLAADFCQDGSPALSGKAKSWAAGLIWAIGRVNFLSDPSFEPCMTQKEFSKAIGVSTATISAKCREVWDGLQLMQLDPDYIVESKAKDNPLAMLADLVSRFPIDASGFQSIETTEQPQQGVEDEE